LDCGREAAALEGGRAATAGVGPNGVRPRTSAAGPYRLASARAQAKAAALLEIARGRTPNAFGAPEMADSKFKIQDQRRPDEIGMDSPTGAKKGRRPAPPSPVYRLLPTTHPDLPGLANGARGLVPSAYCLLLLAGGGARDTEW
jgi:hypothetical protein